MHLSPPQFLAGVAAVVALTGNTHGAVTIDAEYLLGEAGSLGPSQMLAAA